MAHFSPKISFLKNLLDKSDNLSDSGGMNKVTLLQGHVLPVLQSLPPESVHLVVTSPPYWGLRDYGIEPQMWPDGWHGSLGLEPTIELFVEHMVVVFREVRRVLRKDGVLFLNLGDSYMANCSNQNPSTKQHKGAGHCGPNRTPQINLKPPVKKRHTLPPER